MKQTTKSKTASAAKRQGSNGSTRGNTTPQPGRKNQGMQERSNGNGHATGRARQQGQMDNSLLGKFFLDQLKDIYYAETKIAKALPKMEKAATTDELKEAFDDHLHQTQKHIKRLEKVFQVIHQQPEGKVCEAIEGITKEADTIINETEEGSMTRDAALIMAAQKVEHYEIATYGGLVQLALTMGLDEAADILDRTLIEEEQTDLLLTDIAETQINFEAEEEGDTAWSRASEEEAPEEQEV